MQTQEVADIENELNEVIAERDNTERSIRNVTAEPFMKREEGNSVATRVEDLKDRLRQKEQEAKEFVEAAKKTQEEHAELKHQVDSLGRDKRDLETKHSKIKGDFQDNMDRNRGPSEQEAF